MVGADLPCIYDVVPDGGYAWAENWPSRSSSMGSLTVRGARVRWLRFVEERLLRRARSEARSILCD